MPRIVQMYAFVAEEAPGDEGVTAFLNPRDGTWLPMVGADWARVTMLRPIAEGIAKERGVKIRLVRFSVREDLENFEP